MICNERQRFLSKIRVFCICYPCHNFHSSYLCLVISLDFMLFASNITSLAVCLCRACLKGCWPCLRLGIIVVHLIWFFWSIHPSLTRTQVQMSRGRWCVAGSLQGESAHRWVTVGEKTCLKLGLCSRKKLDDPTVLPLTQHHSRCLKKTCMSTVAIRMRGHFHCWFQPYAFDRVQTTKERKDDFCKSSPV